jgi:general secretion pathway protein L
MRETLHIRLREPGSEAPVAYALTSGDAPVSVLVREAPLAEVLQLAAQRRLVLYVPGEDVRLLSANLPVRQAAKALLAAPYALEEQFAEDVETLHFAVAPQPLANNEWPVAVVAEEQLRAWLAPFLTRGLTPDALVPETLALPWRDDGRWTVLAEPGKLSVRTGAYSGFGCLAEDFELFLGLAEGEHKHALRILIGREVETDFTRLERDVELLPGLEHPLEAFARHYRPAQSINLLQGAYAQQRGFSKEWQAWKLPVGLLAAAFLLGSVGNGLSALSLKRQAAQQQASNEARFRELFPSEQRVVNLRVQAEQQFALAQGSAKGAGLLPLMDALAAGLKAAPTLQLDGLQYREGALFLSLSGSDLAALDQLRAYYTPASGARLDVQSANSGEEGLQIRIKLSPA